MSWVTIIWSMVASACLVLAGIHFLVWCQRRREWDDLLLSLASVAVAALAGCELWMMQAETPAQFATALRWLHVPTWVIILSLVSFVRLHLRAGRPWLAWTVCTLRTLSVLLNFLVGQNLNYLEVARLQHIRFLGESVAIAKGTANPWMLVGQLSMVLWLVFVADAAITVWRRGDTRQSLALGGSIVLFVLVGAGQAVLVLWQIVDWPITASIFFMGIVVAMTYQMTGDVLRAAQMSNDLRKKDHWLDLAADSAGVGLWLWDLKTNVISGTETTRMLYGFSANELVPVEKVRARLHPDDFDWVSRALEKCSREGADFRYDYRIVLPDGSIRWFRVLARTLLPSSGEPELVAGVSIDITERKRAEQEIERQRNELTHVTRVSAMGQLASSLAHELNQPLGAILRNAEAAELFLQDPSPDLDELRAIFADIRKDDQRAGEVIDRMRALMKYREGAERSRLDLHLLALDTVTLVRPDAERRRVRLEVETGPAVPPVHGDQVQLQQVLLNLLLNAMDALDDNPSARRFVTVRARPAGAMVEVTVRDTGHGIPVDKLPHLFEPFFSSKPNGLGMGLAISRDIIRAHGGRMWAENNPDGGATLHFTVPASSEGGRGERVEGRGRKEQ